MVASHCAIADMELARSDGTKDRFYSMSSQIEAEKKITIGSWIGSAR